MTTTPTPPPLLSRVANTSDWDEPQAVQDAAAARTQRLFATVPDLLRLNDTLHPYAALVGQSMVLAGHAIYSLQDAWEACPWLTQGQVRYGLGILVDAGLLEREQDRSRTVIYYLMGYDDAGLPLSQVVADQQAEIGHPIGDRQRARMAALAVLEADEL